MFGLKIAALEAGEPVPEIFDEFFDRATAWHLSTSNVEFPKYTGGFSASTEDGCKLFFILLIFEYFIFIFCF